MNALVMIDEPFGWPAAEIEPAARKHGTIWCHLWTEPGNERALHRIAEKIGLKRSWFQDRADFPHYDVVPGKRQAAIAAGAVPFTLAGWIRKRMESTREEGRTTTIEVQLGSETYSRLWDFFAGCDLFTFAGKPHRVTCIKQELREGAIYATFTLCSI